MGAEPVSIPGGQRARPVVAALYGELKLHAWRDPYVESPDLYGLFYARSSAMGWLTEAVEGAKGGFWAMNEAEHDASSQVVPHMIAWCQVDLTYPDPAGRVPLQPLLTCLGDAVARIGAAQISAIQIAIPELEPGRTSSASALDALTGDEMYWFLNSEPESTTEIRVTFDGGSDPRIGAAAPNILGWVKDAQSVVSFDTVVPADEALDPLDRFFGTDTWPGPQQNRATIPGTLVEWSLDALGWLATLVAAAASHQGVSTPWTLTITGANATRASGKT